MATSTKNVIILGGGIAGLCVAAALKNRFEEIVILDQDSLDANSRARGGVPQGTQGHNLLAGGYRAFGELFPGWEAELKDHSVSEFDWGSDVTLLGLFGWHLQSPSAFKTRSLSRGLLEHCIRTQLKNNSKVEIVGGSKFDRLIWSPSQDRVVGVVCRSSTGEESHWQAPLIIDTLGRSSPLPKILKSGGFDFSTETIDPKLSYSSVVVRSTRDLKEKMFFITPKPPSYQRAAMLAKVEDGQWILTFASLCGANPPRTVDEFQSLALELRAPSVADFLKTATFESKITLFGNTANRWHHFETMARYPEGLLFLGDSTMALNPIYGQGMTVVAQAALELKKIFSSRRTPSSQSIQQQVTARSKTAWEMAASQDSRLVKAMNSNPKIQPKKKRRRKSLGQTLMLRVAHGALSSTVLRDAYLSITQLTRSPARVLFDPRVIVAAAFHPLPSKKGKAT